MKQTKQGARPEEIRAASPPKWAGKKASCPKCKAEYELEAKDVPRKLDVARSPDGPWRAEFPCLSQFAAKHVSDPQSGGRTYVPESRCDGVLVVEGKNNEP